MRGCKHRDALKCRPQRILEHGKAIPVLRRVLFALRAILYLLPLLMEEDEGQGKQTFVMFVPNDNQSRQTPTLMRI
jgi:hypothetical protein